MSNQEKNCASKVQAAMESSLNDLRIMLAGFTVDDIQLIDDGSLDTVISILDREFRFSDTSEYRDENGVLDLDQWYEAELKDDDSIRSELYEAFTEYGLAFDYVAPGTFRDQDQGYFRYQLSWGGPSEEFRFYVNPDLSMYHCEFWFLDWSDGAETEVPKDIAQLIYSQFEETGTCQALIAKGET